MQLMKLRNSILILTAAMAWPAAAAVTWDTSGNGMLQGKYYFRHLAQQGVGATGAITEASVLYGTITFDGNGNYTATGQLYDSTIASTPQTFSFTTGTYSISASGFGYIDNPQFTNESVIGMVSRGVFVGSSTEGSTNDVFVAVAAGSSAATTSTLSGKYWLGYMNYRSLSGATALDAMIPVTANGAGGFTGAITATGYAGTSSSVVTQSISSLSYSFSSGVGTLVFPSSGSLITGNKIFYVSSDGNFVVGGSASGYDLILGVRAASGTVANSLYSGLYYAAGIDQDNSTSGFPILDTYYGALTSTGTGTILRDDRLAYFDSLAYDYTYDTGYSLNPDGTYNSYQYQYALGASGLGFVSIGTGPVLAVGLGVKGPDLSGSGVYLNPTGVVNGASFSPFIGGISPGEVITLFGTNLAPSLANAPAIPYLTTLNHVQVTIDGTPAPIIYVSPGQLSVIVPYATELANACYCAAIQVINNGIASNTVTVFANDSTPGVFSLTANGVGYGAVLHADYSVVSKSNPAKRGETLLVFTAGLGAVTPAVNDGVAPSASPLSYTTRKFDVYIDTVTATTSYVGLAPGFPGLYQINVAVPSAAGSGDVYLDIQDDVTGFYTTQVKIPVQ